MSYPDYTAPTTLEEALEILGDTARIIQVLAGGTNLIPRLRSGEIEPHLLVDIRLLPLNLIRLEKDYLRLGAGVTYSQIMEDDMAVRYFPALVKACREIGSPSIRNRGTLGGNLAACIPEADTVPPLLVYDAQISMAKGKTERTTPLSDFYRTSGESILEPGELIKEILLPLPAPATSAYFIKSGNRRGMTTAVVNAAVRISLDQKRYIREARIALGAYAQKPFRAEAAESMLVGCRLNEAPFDRFARLAVESNPARTDLFVGADYRKKLARVLIARGLREVCTDLNKIEFHD